MPRRPPPRPPKGSRFGQGRAKGTPNKVSVEVRQLVSELVTNASYQQKLRRDFQARKVHPTIESLVWAYYLGKPRQDIAVTATVTVDAKIEAERRAFALLDLRDMEVLAAESQALVDRAMALARARIPQDVVVEAEPVETGAELLGNTSGSDNSDSVTYEANPDSSAVSDDSPSS